MTRRKISRPFSTLRDAAAEAVQRYRHVLDQQDSRTLLVAAVFSVIGDWLNFVALMALAYDFGGGALGVGGLLALRLVPGLVFQGIAGTVVDRVRDKRLLVLTQIFMAGLAWTFIVLNAIESLWLLYLIVIFLEIANTFARPAFMVELVSTVEPGHRGAVNGLFGMAMTIAQFAGSLLGAILLSAIGTTLLFLINGLTFAAIAFTVSRLKLIDRTRATKAQESARALVSPQSAWNTQPEELRSSTNDAVQPTERGFAGYARLLMRPDIFVFTVLTLTVSMLIQGTAALFEVRARSLDLHDGGGGVFFAAVAVGFLVGGAIAGAGRYRSKSTLYLIATAELVGAVGLIAFGVANSLAVACFALVVTGISAELSEIPAFTYFQNRLPTDVYGRFFSLYLMATAAGGLIGALTGPLLERYISDGQTMLVLAIPGLATAIILAGIARFGDPDDSEPTPSVFQDPVPAVG